jgi:hypothetical protein
MGADHHKIYDDEKAREKKKKKRKEQLGREEGYAPPDDAWLMYVDYGRVSLKRTPQYCIDSRRSSGMRGS